MMFATGCSECSHTMISINKWPHSYTAWVTIQKNYSEDKTIVHEILYEMSRNIAAFEGKATLCEKVCLKNIG